MVINHTKLADVEKLGIKDTSGLIELSQSVGWDYDEEELNTIFSTGSAFGHKTSSGQLVSSAAIIPYSGDVASIGMVIVNKEYRGMGLAKEVTNACINSVPDNTKILLIATKEGVPLYTRMGFKQVACVHKFLCDQYFPEQMYDFNGLIMENFTIGVIDKIIELDGKAFGEKRELFLKTRIRQSHKSMVVKNTENQIIGYGLSILGPENLILGPIVAPNDIVANFIIHKLAHNHEGRLRIDVPSGKESFMQDLIKSGFEKVNQPPIMAFRADELPSRNNNLYGIAAQIFG